MRASRGWLCALFFSVVALAGSGMASSSNAQTIGAEASGLTGGLVVEGAEELMPGLQAAAEGARHANPQAGLARTASADAFQNLVAASAERLAGESFPGLVDRRAGGPPQLPAGTSLTGYLTPYAAQIDVGGTGQRGVIESSVPMAIEGGHGLAPVDLGLREASGGYEGTEALVVARLPKHLEEGARLPGIGLSVTPVDDRGVPLDATGVIDAASDFAANSLTDSDTVLKLSTFGLSVDTVLRSADSPQQLSFRIGMPAGAHLVTSAEEPGAVRVVRNGATIATMPAPSAADAAGAYVPVSVSVTGDEVTLRVAHEIGQYLYPIDVDPEFNTTTESKINSSTWQFQHYGEASAHYPGEEMWMELDNGPRGDWASFVYATKGTSKLYEISDTTTAEPTEGGELGEGRGGVWVTNGESYIEFAGAGGTEKSQILYQPQVPFSETPLKTNLCANISGEACTSASGSAGNVVKFVLRATSEYGGPQLRVKPVTVSISQPKETHSTVSYNTSSPELEYTSSGKVVKTINVLYNGDWMGPNSGAFEFKSEDAGLGVSGTEVEVYKSPVWWNFLPRNYLTEGGACEGVQCAKAQKETVSYSMLSGALVNGNNTIRVKADDPMSATWSSEHGEGEATLKVDTAAPHGIVLSGLANKGGVYELDETIRKVKIEAIDGEGSTLSSGIKSLTIGIDGREIGKSAGSCPQGPCTATGEWSVNGGELGAGTHVLTAIATDNAGNVTSKEFLLNVQQASPVAVGPGSVDPESGNFALDATDVNISGGQGALTVSRDHKSRNPQEGAEGPLGPQWTISLGSLASLQVLPDGSVMVVGPEGLSHFANKAGGGFEAPMGDTSLTLEAVTNEGKITAYLLKNPAKGTTTTFTLPTGAKSWMPTVSEGPVATNTTTDEYTTAEPEAGKKIVEPILEVAPHPSAVCAFKKLEKGCRALEFNYAASTTATGESQSGWGDYKGRLTRVYFIAWNPANSEMTTTTVAQYSYDTQGRLRAEWDPRLSTPLKTIYGYDPEGHVTALTPPGEETSTFTYGAMEGDVTSGRLLRTTRAPASAPLWSGNSPANTIAPAFTPEAPTLGASVSVSSGTWSDSPVSYGYQWQRCNESGAECVAIVGAKNEAYKPTLLDMGHKLRVEVQATNGGGSTVAYTVAAKVVIAPVYKSKFGSFGTGSGQFKYPHGAALDSSGNLWVADTGNNRVSEFTAAGSFIRQFGTAGTSNGQFNEPMDVAVTPEGNIWVTDALNHRVQEFSSAGTYLRQFGSEGTGAGQFVEPAGITVTPSGNVWVTDARYYRVEEFSSTGAYIRQVGTPGSGNAQFGSPTGIASDSYGDVWVADESDNRVQELSPTGEYIRQAGSEGTGRGQFKGAAGVAVDSTGEVWVADRFGDRIEGFNARGEYLTQYGSEGSTNGKFAGPRALAVAGSGAIYVVDLENQRIQELSPTTSTFSYYAKFGSSGSGSGQFKYPHGAALDSSGNLWVADTGNNRVSEFTAAGSFIRQFGTAGTSNGQFNEPMDVAVTPEGNIWVTDALNHRVQEFSSAGTYLRQFGSEGTGAGQFVEPAGITVTPSGNVWVTDARYYRVEEFSSTGAYIRQVGTPGSGNAQFGSPTGIASDSYGDVWVADESDNRVQELSPTGEYIRQAGSEGTGRGQFKGAAGVAVDSTGEVWVADRFGDRIEGFNALGEYIGQYGSEGTGSGQFKEPWALALSKTGSCYVVDGSNGRIQQLVAPSSTSEPAAAPPTEGAALTTVVYGVPLSGADAPYAMASSDVATWGQTDAPSIATAIFPPDEPVGWPAPDYKRAVVSYMDSQARTTNVAVPSGAVSTAEYNEYNDVVRTLDGANRAKALEEGAKSAEVAKLLDSESVYSEQGSRLMETFGPQHTVKIAKGNEKVPSGSEVPVREHVKYYYDEGAPATGETYNLVTKTTDGGATAGSEEFDVRTNTTSYSGQSNLGWKLREPTSTTTDPAGLKITHTTVYDETTGAVLETRGPASAEAGDTHDVVSVYYTAAPNHSYLTCGRHVEWSGLPCQTLPGKQPETSGLPSLPVSTTRYNILDQPEEVEEAFGSTTRTKKTTFDVDGRPVKTEVTSTNGVATPGVTNHYNERTGALVKESETFEGKEIEIAMQYDRLGRIENYMDADGGLASYKYDIDGRILGIKIYTPTLETRGEQTYTYATSGFMTRLIDSAAGTFKATYDVAGRIMSETYPNSMTATYTRNAVGQSVGVEYSKTASCATTCPEKWFSDVAVPSSHGETLKESSTLSEEPNETFDQAGRLTQVQEITPGHGCTTRIYGYDQESNRTSLTTRAPGSEGRCATEGGSVESHTYDSANRLIDSGVSYETFGNITTLPAADAGGAGMEVTSSYYVDSQLASQTQHGVTTGYYMDPSGRLRETRSPSVSVTHYAGAGSAVAWMSEPESKWTRDIPGIDGSLSATQSSTGAVTLLLHDLQGNVVATAALSSTETKLLSTYSSTEFGVPVNGSPPKYAWLGATGMASSSPTGLIVQNGVTYVPQTGRPLQTQGLALPEPDNAASPYVMILAPWVIEGTAAVARQLTNAEEARRAAEQAAQSDAGGGGSGGGQEIGGGLSEIDGGDEASISAVPSCQFHWSLAEYSGTLKMFGKFRCKHKVENMEIEMCIWHKYPNKPWSGALCTGKEEKGLVVKNTEFAEEILDDTCETGIVYTGQMWTREWSGYHIGQFWSSGSIFDKNYPRLACEGADAGEYMEVGEAFA